MAKKSREFAAKDRIEHEVFGTGTILEIDPYHVSILFDESGQRKFVTSIVKLAPSDTPAPTKPVRRKKTTAKKKKKKTKATKATKTTKKATKAAKTPAKKKATKTAKKATKKKAAKKKA